MENKIEIFKSEEFGQIRTIVRDGEPWFVGKDIAEALGYELARKAISDHIDNEDKRLLTKNETFQNGTLENIPNRGLIIINESGLYSLVLSSKLPTAKKFKRWVTNEVLPSIRKHGIYATPETIDKIIAEPENAIKIFTALKEEREKRIAAENALQEAQPKLTYYEKILASKGNMRTTQIAKDYGMSAQRLNKLLNEASLIWKVGNQWVLYAKYDRQGYTDTETIEYADGKCSTVRTLWTQRGRLKIHQILTSKGIVANCDRNKQFKVNTVGKQVEFNAKVAARNLA